MNTPSAWKTVGSSMAGPWGLLPLPSHTGGGGTGSGRPKGRAHNQSLKCLVPALPPLHTPLPRPATWFAPSEACRGMSAVTPASSSLCPAAPNTLPVSPRPVSLRVPSTACPGVSAAHPAPSFLCPAPSLSPVSPRRPPPRPWSEGPLLSETPAAHPGACRWCQAGRARLRRGFLSSSPVPCRRGCPPWPPPTVGPLWLRPSPRGSSRAESPLPCPSP